MIIVTIAFYVVVSLPMAALAKWLFEPNETLLVGWYKTLIVALALEATERLVDLWKRWKRSKAR